MSDDKQYAAAQKARQEHIEKILASSAVKKVVVAGPGTGKTYLFKRIIHGKTKTLTLSFVNALVDDLSLELFGLSEVRTLHGYARSTLALALKREIRIFPKLPHVMRDDAKLLLGKDIDFDHIFHNRDDNNENIGFYSDRHKYYGYYGYSDITYAATKYLEAHKDKVPTYDQVVVDEFQDFNLLEVSLIDALAENSPVLLAGDDDQALYGFKSAKADHIRERYSGTGSPYEGFNLPYCARCTRVIVEATNDVVMAAKADGLLAGRIDKPYLYFDHKEKDAESDKYNRIDYKQLYSAQIPWAIETGIDGMAQDMRGQFYVLVITATSTQCRITVEALRNKGFENVSFADREKPEPVLLDGLKLIALDKTSNLGWRIVARCSIEDEEFKKILVAAGTGKAFVDVLERDFKNTILGLVRLLKKVESESITDEELPELLKRLDINPFDRAKEELRKDLEAGAGRGRGPTKKIPIKVTTVQSSKGLAADLVFITHFDDQYFIRNKDKTKISDQDVCNFIVALTRARKKVVLVSSSKREPTFLKWIDPARIQR